MRLVLYDTTKPSCTHRFDVEVQYGLHVSGQLCDDSEVAEDGHAVRDDDGPNRTGRQHGSPWHVGMLK